MNNHRNTQTTGPCHYFWLRGRDSHRVLFRQNEIRDVDATPMGAIVTTHQGCEYKVSCPTPELITPEGLTFGFDPARAQAERAARVASESSPP